MVNADFQNKHLDRNRERCNPINDSKITRNEGLSEFETKEKVAIVFIIIRFTWLMESRHDLVTSSKAMREARSLRQKM